MDPSQETGVNAGEIEVKIVPACYDRPGTQLHSNRSFQLRNLETLVAGRFVYS
jgi:hypothetical protein